jgi:hypothetical protein
MKGVPKYEKGNLTMLKNRRKFIALFLTITMIFSMSAFSASAFSGKSGLSDGTIVDNDLVLIVDIVITDPDDPDYGSVITYLPDIILENNEYVETEIILTQDVDPTVMTPYFLTDFNTLIIVLEAGDNGFQWRVTNSSPNWIYNIKMEWWTKQGPNAWTNRHTTTIASLAPFNYTLTTGVECHQLYISEAVRREVSADGYGSSGIKSANRVLSSSRYSHWWRGDQNSNGDNVEAHFHASHHPKNKTFYKNIGAYVDASKNVHNFSWIKSSTAATASGWHRNAADYLFGYDPATGTNRMLSNYTSRKHTYTETTGNRRGAIVSTSVSPSNESTWSGKMISFWLQD